MPIQNADIERIFRRTANLLEIEGANPFRVRAYRNAARTAAGLSRDIADMVEAGEDLTRLSGIGRDLSEKIREIVQTGKLRQLEELERRLHPGLNRLLKIRGLGPKRVESLYRHLGVATPEELEKAAEKKKVRKLEGFGKKTENSILEEISNSEKEERIALKEAEQRAAPLLKRLGDADGVARVHVAGSFRRRKETVGDLDILVSGKKSADAMDLFTGYEQVREVVSKGDSRSSVVLKSGLRVDLRVLPPESYGAGLHYFTGSRAHNIAIRERGLKKGLKINEYGIFKGEKRVAGKTEREVYEYLGLCYIEPELREDAGEIEAAERKSLPDLVRVEDIRGDLHAHSDYTDGQDSLEDMAREARRLGHEYLAITDHSRKVAMAGGLEADGIASQIEHIDRLNEKLDGIRLLKGIEVDILKDGSLDLPDEILHRLDIRVCSVHYNRNLSRKKQTERILKAMENPYFNILAHPAGRIVGKRKGLDIDLEKIMEAARENGCILELNADPERLDLSDTHCRMAGEIGVKIAISTDAHSTGSLGFMRFGIDQARRGWLEAKDVVNTRDCNALLKLMKRN